MKQNLLGRLAAAAVLLLGATTATAHDFEVNGIYYKKNSDGTSVCVTERGSYSYPYDKEYSGAVTIPASVTYSGKTYSVTGIYQEAFRNCRGLESVAIPNSVITIGNYTFDGCSGLTSVSIGNSVSTIGIYAFYGCSSLTSVEIPNSVTSIGFAAFDGCSGLTSVSIGNSVTSIGSYAFDGCSGLTSVVIPNSVKSIGDSAFRGCSGLTSVSIGNSVTSIGDSAFSGCSGLTSVSIGNSVTSIGDSAFDGCSGLTSVEIPNSVTSIGNYAFEGCSGLQKVEISNLEAWCKISFYDVYANPTYYSHNLFLNGQEIKNLVIPETVQELKFAAFYGCSGLTSVEIPNSVTSIGGSAFGHCSGLKSVEIPNSVTGIGDNAFYGCSGLTSVEIPNSVTSIEWCAFNNCNNLAMVFYNATNCTIGTYYSSVFNTNCTFVIGENVTQLSDNLLSSNFSGKIVPLASVPPVISANMFSSSATVYVSPDAYISYWMDENWGKMTLQEISTPVTSIALNAESLHITTTTKSASLEATVTPADATLKDLYWTSSDPLIATVDQNGLVTRRREGSATITACAIDGSGAMANCQVTVDAIIAESLELSPAELSLSPNKSYRINAIYTPDDISSKNFEWSCSDEGVATFIKNLDGSIIVTAIAYGNATITCRTTDGSNLTATCEVTVVPELELDPSEITLSRNKTAVIYPVFLPEGTPDRPCEWSCSDESVVRYKANSDGSITIIGASDGKAIITCHTTDGSDLTATCEVTVGTGTGVEGVSSTAAKVRGENGVIRVEGAEGARVEVYSASGVCIYSGTATEVPVPQRGLYVVKVAGRATKLAM